jgi:acyl-CoA thioesterase
MLTPARTPVNNADREFRDAEGTLWSIRRYATMIVLMSEEDATASAFDLSLARRQTGTASFQGRCQDGWTVGGHANGGWLLAFCHSVLSHHAAHRSLLSVTGQFMRPITAGAFDVSVDVLREGARLSTVRAHVSQEDRLALVVASSFGERAADEAPSYLTATPPALAPPSQCIGLGPDLAGRPARITEQVDVRIAPDDSGWLEGRPSGTAEMRAWIRHRDGRPLDTSSVVLACDVMPPAARNAGIDGWLATVGFTINIRAAPRGGWLIGHSRTSAVTTRTVDESLELWDGTGSLIAQAHQLRVRVEREVAST